MRASITICSGASGCSQFNRSSSVMRRGGATSGTNPGFCTSPACMMRVSLCTHGTRTSRVFHVSTTTPPGRSRRANSADAAGTSTQCHVCAHVMASKEPPARPVSSAVARTRATPGQARANPASISAPGSTAVTRWPAATSPAVNLPVPAPTSRTSSAAPARSPSASNATTSGG